MSDNKFILTHAMDDFGFEIVPRAQAQGNVSHKVYVPTKQMEKLGWCGQIEFVTETLDNRTETEVRVRLHHPQGMIRWNDIAVGAVPEKVAFERMRTMLGERFVTESPLKSLARLLGCDIPSRQLAAA